ncbi:MAG: hypothetical protein WC197_05250 [Candidatus Gastranaerophilaceae bacterium]
MFCLCLVSCNKEPEVSALKNPQDLNPNTTVNANIPQVQPQSIVDTDKFEKKVIVPVENYGRLDPFFPYSEKNIVSPRYNTLANIPKINPSEFRDLPLPPSSSNVNSKLRDLIQAKVTGILYDRYRPAAIINIMGEDQLVKKGDNISGFYIQDIKKDYVFIKSGFNTYKTTIGEIIDGGPIATTGNSNTSSFGNLSSNDKIDIKPLQALSSPNGLPSPPKI